MMPGQFHSLAEVDAWLDRERLLCPQCVDGGHPTRRGQRHLVGFTDLGRHLSCVHGITADDFRARYGIPHNRGLIGARLKERLSARQRATLARDPEHRAKFTDPTRRRPPYSVHAASAAQLGELRNRIQPLGNQKRWAKHNK